MSRPRRTLAVVKIDGGVMHAWRLQARRAWLVEALRTFCDEIERGEHYDTSIYQILEPPPGWEDEHAERQQAARG